MAQYLISNFGTANVWVEFGTDTSYGRQTSVVAETGQYNNTATVLVAGMKSNTTYHMRAHVDYKFGGSWVDNDHTFQTGPLPAGNQLAIKVTRPNPNLGVKQDGVELLDLLTAGTNLGAVVSDLDGNIIWFYPPAATAFPFPLKPLPNGDMYLNVYGIVVESDLAGSTIRSLTLDQLNQRLQDAGFSITLAQLHHDVLFLPNGHWVFLGQVVQTFTNLPGYPGSTQVQGDVLIDVDQDWNPVWVWSSFDHLDVNRHLMGLPDWTHSNAVIYSPTDGNIVLSMRNQSWVLKIDYENGTGSGDILWRLGQDGDFQLSENDPSQWFYAQHFPYLVSTTGTQSEIAVFDDGDLRIPSGGGEGCTGFYPDCYTRGVILDLDESTKVASVKWQFLPELYTSWGGSIDTLDNGDVDLDVTDPYGPATFGSSVFEVTQSASPEVVWKMDISGADAYRAYRIPSLYPGVVWH